eukprot:7339679-Lingulodinium_polyedra.AAC.1
MCLARVCQGGHRHERFQGRVAWTDEKEQHHSHWRAEFVGRYPPVLCQRWVGVFRAVAPRRAVAPHGAGVLRGDWEAQLAAIARCEPAGVRPSCPRQAVE